ncbi:DUF5689 domain-containing protein [Mucilaginibacter paludis]|uniref:DUF5689 domain-containing protein n=1 Tax=Mucilaginibacter paludis DSM 18603 TaxID=714943 RepID=H1YHD9_9SPHI|nr:DUF5689 domain-containing protein [Mucilaginibacter paludis]EHQ25473.1 hypothetical protein Mucpa_1311 [Mucilaginibacter paludis DSM 18603]
MKTKTTIKQTLTALVIALSIVSCKKDKKADPVTPPVEVKVISLTDLKTLSAGASVKVPDGKKISGIVISDVAGKNTDTKTVILQDAASQTGIIINFDAAQTFAPGDQLEVNISNQTLAQVNGEVVLQNIPAANAKKTGTGTVTAKATTIVDINTNKIAWNGTLVSVNATDLTSANSKYEGNLTIKDASGTLTSAVLTTAAFTGTALPVSVSKITGIVRLNGTDARLDIRSQADVTPGDISKIISDDFTTWTDATPGTNVVTTSKEAWYAIYSNLGALKYKGIAADANFTVTDKTYPYLPVCDEYVGPGSQGSFLAVDPALDFKGLKSIKVTFAGSNVVGKGQFTGVLSPLLNGKNTTSPYNFQAFDANTDKLKIGIYAIVSGTWYFLAESGEYKETGKFFTVTFNFPTTAAALQAANPQIPGGTALSDFMEKPAFSIVNRSIGNPSGTDYKLKQRPILIDKVELGF